MGKVFFLGDTHGSLKHTDFAIETVRAHGLSEIYQVGDFGYWEHEFKGEIFLDELSKNLIDAEITLYWIDGNHENFELLYHKYDITGPGEYEIRPNLIYLARGTAKEIFGKKFVFCGGAVSIDKRIRSPYISWWPQEQITYQDSNNTIKNGRGADVLVIHDAPVGIKTLDDFLGKDNAARYPQAHSHRGLLYKIAVEIKPKLIIHGHYHHLYVDEFNYGTGKSIVYGLGYDQDPATSYKIIETDNIK